jgi:hypothetical protein
MERIEKVLQKSRSLKRIRKNFSVKKEYDSIKFV